MKKILITLILIGSSLALSAQIDTVNIGAAANDGTGDTPRAAFLKVNNFIDDYNRIALYDILAAEMAILDGALWSTTEGNYLVGVTSGIQAQLNLKLAASDTTSMLTNYLLSSEIASAYATTDNLNLKLNAANGALTGNTTAEDIVTEAFTLGTGNVELDDIKKLATGELAIFDGTDTIPP